MPLPPLSSANQFPSSPLPGVNEFTEFNASINAILTDLEEAHYSILNTSKPLRVTLIQLLKEAKKNEPLNGFNENKLKDQLESLKGRIYRLENPHSQTRIHPHNHFQLVTKGRQLNSLNSFLEEAAPLKEAMRLIKETLERENEDLKETIQYLEKRKIREEKTSAAKKRITEIFQDINQRLQLIKIEENIYRMSKPYFPAAPQTPSRNTLTLGPNGTPKSLTATPPSLHQRPKTCRELQKPSD